MEDAGGKTTPELNDKLDSLGRFLIVTVIALPVLSKFIDFKPFVSITGALSYGDLVMIFVTIGIVFFAKKQFDLQKRQHVFDRDMQEKNHEFEVKVQSANWKLALHGERVELYHALLKTLISIRDLKVLKRSTQREFALVVHRTMYHVPKKEVLGDIDEFLEAVETYADASDRIIEIKKSETPTRALTKTDLENIIEQGDILKNTAKLLKQKDIFIKLEDAFYDALDLHENLEA